MWSRDVKLDCDMACTEQNNTATLTRLFGLCAAMAVPLVDDDGVCLIWNLGTTDIII